MHSPPFYVPMWFFGGGLVGIRMSPTVPRVNIVFLFLNNYSDKNNNNSWTLMYQKPTKVVEDAGGVEEEKN